MKVYVLTYETTVTETFEDAESVTDDVEVLCYKSGHGPAIFTDAAPAERLAAELRSYYPALTYKVTEVKL